VVDELDPRAPQRGGEAHRQRRRSGAAPDELASLSVEHSASWMGLCRTRSSPRVHRMDIKSSACGCACFYGGACGGGRAVPCLPACCT
jgi:hypothetical protein